MDLFDGPVDPTFENQVHDFNPGTRRGGLFWTKAVRRSEVRVSLPDGWARMDVHDLDMKDYFNIGNALFGGGPDPVPAVVSYDIRWHDKSGQQRVRNAKQDFAALVFDMDAEIEWQATSEGVSYASTGAAQEALFAVIGKERNGRFFG